MPKPFIHAQHCRCHRCAPVHPADDLYPGAFRVAVLLGLVIASWALAIWAAAELRDLLFTWSSL
jgi:hypothetical protein